MVSACGDRLDTTARCLPSNHSTLSIPICRFGSEDLSRIALGVDGYGRLQSGQVNGDQLRPSFAVNRQRRLLATKMVASPRESNRLPSLEGFLGADETEPVRQMNIPILSIFSGVDAVVQLLPPEGRGKQRDSRVVEIQGIISLSRGRTDLPTDQTYCVARILISFYGWDGRKMFEHFHLAAIPDLRPSDFLNLQDRLKASLRSYLKRFGVVDPRSG